MGALFAGLPFAAESVAEEGRRIIIGMLLVGFIFLGVILIGQLARWLSHRRQARRRPRPY